MVSNVILDLTIHNIISRNGKRDKIKSLPSITSKDINQIRYNQFSTQYDSLIIPVNDENIHWILLVFEFKAKTLHILDPFPLYKTITLEKEFANDLETDNWKIDTHPHGITKQNQNTLDCGIFVIKYAQKFIIHNTFHGISSDVNTERIKLKKYFEEKLRKQNEQQLT